MAKELSLSDFGIIKFVFFESESESGEPFSLLELSEEKAQSLFLVFKTH